MKQEQQHEPADPPSAATSAREADIAAMASLEGARWASSWFEALRREGRPVAGGWPGTLSEARARVASSSRALGLSALEIRAAAKLAYVAARKAWAANAEPDDETERPSRPIGRESR